MKILIVSFAFPPSNAIGAVRVGKMAKEFLSRGHEVRVLTAKDDTLPHTLNTEVSEELVTRTPWFNVNWIPFRFLQSRGDFHKKGYAPSNPLLSWLGNLYKTLLNFPDGQIGWLPFALRTGMKLVRNWRPDVIYCSAMPFTSLIVGSILSKRSGVPWIAEYRDLWVDSHYYDFPFWRRWFESRLESAIVKDASGFVTVSELWAEVLRKNFGKPTATVLNGFDAEDFISARGRADTDSDTLDIVYTGMVYPGRRDPSPLFDAIARLGPERDRVRVTFYGRLLPGVEELAEEYGVGENVTIHEAVAYHESLQCQMQADVLLLLLWDDPRERGTFSGKLYEYLGARRPILLVGLEDGVAASLVRERKVGFAATDPNAIRDELKKWLVEKADKGRLPRLPSSVVADLTRKKQFESLESFVSEVLAAVSIAKAAVTPARAEPRDVLIVARKLDVGGTEHHLLKVLPRLNRAGIVARVYALRGGGTLEPSFSKAGVSVSGPSPAWPSALEVLAGSVGLLSVLYRKRPAIVHFFLPEPYIVGGFLARLAPRRILVMSRRSLNNYQRRYPLLAFPEYWLHRRMDAVLGNSKAVVAQLREEGAPEERLGLVYNGLDVAQFDNLQPRAQLRAQIGLGADTLVLVTVAKLFPYKGHADLLNALAAARESLPEDWAALLVGRDDGIGPALQKQMRDLDLSAHVRWLGERLDVANILGAADIGVHPSHEEGFSNSILEGMAAGLPMVVTEVGGNTEAVIDGVTGRVVPPQDPDSLGRAILELARDSKLRSDMGGAGRRRVAREFSLESTVDQYRHLYTRLLGARLEDLAGPLESRET